MSPETANALIEQQRAENPQVVALARHLSLAVRVEIELLRAMRLEVMPWVEVGVEADLYFSPLVQARDVNALAFIPEVRARLGEELALHHEELEGARRVVEKAHGDMDAVILLEELASYEALRGDRDAYASMQIRLGSVVKTLDDESADPDLLHWAATALPRMPARARACEAGRELAQRIDTGLARLGGASITPAAPIADASVVNVGFRATARGAQLAYPAPAGWTEVPMPSPVPVSLELGWPVPGGWQMQMVELEPDASPLTIADAPLGLLRLRGITGFETKLRLAGPFADARPKLLMLSAGTFRPGSVETIEAEADDLVWQLAARPMPPGGPPLIFISHAGRDDERVRMLGEQLGQPGLRPWFDIAQIKSGEAWDEALDAGLRAARAAVIVISKDALLPPEQEIEYFAARRRSDPAFPLYLLLLDGQPLDELAKTLDPSTYEQLAQLEAARDPAGLAAAVQRDLAGSPAAPAEAACLLRFGSTHRLARFVEELREQDPADAALPWPLDPLVAAGRPIVIRVDAHIEELHTAPATDPDAPGISETDAGARFAAVLQALDGLERSLVAGARRAASDAHEVLRHAMLRGEQMIIAEWLATRAQSARQESADAPESTPSAAQTQDEAARAPAPKRVVVWYEFDRERLAQIVGTRLDRTGIGADVKAWHHARETSDPPLSSFVAENSIRYDRANQVDAERIRDALTDIVDLQLLPHDGAVEMFPGSTWTIDRAQLYVLIVREPALPEWDIADQLEPFFDRVARLDKQLEATPILENRELTGQLSSLLRADGAVLQALRPVED